jgi:hypothetical protein
MNQPTSQSSTVAAPESDKANDATTLPAEQIKEAELGEVNGGVSPPYYPLPYIDQV